MSKACGLQGAVQRTTLRGCRSAAEVFHRHWLYRPPRGREKRLAAKARAAAKESRADQQAVKAEILGPREEAGAALERRRAKSLTKVAVSALQRPPSSRARTTSLHRADCRSSGQWALRASARLASRRRSCTASAPNRPPTSTPTTTRRQRRGSGRATFCMRQRAPRHCAGFFSGVQRRTQEQRPNKFGKAARKVGLCTPKSCCSSRGSGHYGP